MKLLKFRRGIGKNIIRERENKNDKADNFNREYGVNFINLQQNKRKKCNDYIDKYIIAIERLENTLKAGNICELISIYYDLAYRCYYMGDYNQVKFYIEKVHKEIMKSKTNNNQDIMINITMLQLICYDEEKRYSDLLQTIEENRTLINCDDAGLLHGIEILKAKALVGLNRLNEARETYINLLNQGKKIHINKRRTIILQLSKVARQLGYQEESNKFFSQARNTINLLQPELYYQMLKEQAERKQELKVYDQAMDLYKEVVSFLEENSCMEESLEVYTRMGEIQADIGNFRESKYYYTKIRSISDQGDIIF